MSVAIPQLVYGGSRFPQVDLYAFLCLAQGTENGDLLLAYKGKGVGAEVYGGTGDVDQYSDCEYRGERMCHVLVVDLVLRIFSSVLVFK